MHVLLLVKVLDEILDFYLFFALGESIKVLPELKDLLLGDAFALDDDDVVELFIVQVTGFPLQNVWQIVAIVTT